MPKVTSISSRPLRSYDSLLHVPLEEAKANTNVVYIDTSSVWNGQDLRNFYDINQDTVFLSEAVLRATGRHKLQLPIIDQFQTQGRTIYNTDRHDQNHDAALSNVLSLPTKKTRKVIAEPHTPPRKVRVETQSKPHLSRSSQHARLFEDTDNLSLSTPKRRRRGPHTLFVAITEDNEIQFIPNRSISPTMMHFEKADYISDSSDTPNIPGSSMDESFEGGSRCSTPSLSWSDSVNSSPRFDPTIDWNDGFNGALGERTIPMNYEAAGCEPVGLSSGPDIECTGFEESLGHLFDLFINTEDCQLF